LTLRRLIADTGAQLSGETMNHENPRQQLGDSPQREALSGADFIRELTPEELLGVSGGPQLTNDGVVL
jgi:hypothetical protein